MPLFSSSSVRDPNSSGHHNKLEKSPHARSSSLHEKRKIGGLFGRRATADEGASTMAVAGSSARLQKDDQNDNVAIPPLTPKSINGEPAPDDVDFGNLPPTPPGAAEKYGNAISTADGMNDFTQRDGSMRTSSTWRDNHDSTRHKGGLGHSDPSPAFASASMGYHNAHQNAADNLGSYTRDGTDAGATGSGGQQGGADYKTDWGTYGQQDYGHEPMDLATARKKVQFAIEAELAADSALELARHAVQEARNAVKAIERQIYEELEKAQARKTEVDSVLKDLNKLGRHDYKH